VVCDIELIRNINAINSLIISNINDKKRQYIMSFFNVLPGDKLCLCIKSTYDASNISFSNEPACHSLSRLQEI
jgi:hypothetical protein